MKTRQLISYLVPILLVAGGGTAQAQSCTITTAATLNSSSTYDPFSTAFNDTAGVFSISCTRPKGGANRFPATFYVGATNGANYAGGTRRLRLGATTNYLSYGLYRNYSGCTTVWGSTTIADVYSFSNSATGPNVTTTNPNPLTTGTAFCMRITGGASTAPPGTYTDTVQIAIAESPTVIWGTAAVTLTTTIVPACVFNSALPDITLNYTSFQGSSSTGTSSFELKCTNTTTYTVAFDTAAGTVLGLTYNLAVSPSAGSGTGVAQTPPGHTVTATIPANQAGACSGASCTSTITRNVLVTY